MFHTNSDWLYYGQVVSADEFRLSEGFTETTEMKCTGGSTHFLQYSKKINPCGWVTEVPCLIGASVTVGNCHPPIILRTLLLYVLALIYTL